LYNLISDTVEYSTIGGGESNVIEESSDHATIGGGYNNTAGGIYATVSGGYGNEAAYEYTTVGGGWNNVASLGAATVGGGNSNEASNWDATIGGGWDNTASGNKATVGGGYNNTAGAYAATVPGGRDNTAAGSYSFAAGRRAKANHNGTFVWADSNDFDFASTAAGQFSARATGGVQFVLNIDGSGSPTWICSVANGSSWSCSSDRNLKENLVLADGSDILEQLSYMPVYYWNAKGQPTQHIGPMAQDFYAAFSVGDSDTAIATIDLDGVALAAIQGLYAQNQALQAQIDDLEARLEELERRLETGDGAGR
jgi:hypothetical protein